jgi:putative transcriptional regulator
MMTVNNKFGVLLAQKEAILKRNIPLTEVERETGVTRKTLQQWSNNTVTRFDAPVIDALCKYFDCQPGDLLTRAEE